MKCKGCNTELKVVCAKCLEKPIIMIVDNQQELEQRIVELEKKLADLEPGCFKNNSESCTSN